MPERCDWHRPLELGYLAWHAEAERRGARGMRQRQCPACSFWYWRDEWGTAPRGLGWAKGIRDDAA